MKKRVVSWLLVVLMLTSLLPTSVLAEMADTAADAAVEDSLAEDVTVPEETEEQETPETPEAPEETETPAPEEKEAEQETAPQSAAQSADAAVQALSGQGTVSDPYLITSEADLMSLAGQTLYGKSYKLTKDIVMTNVSMTPITKFSSGTFDGDGHTISDLTINVSGSNAGLFAETGSGAVIQGIILKGADISLSGGSRVSVGALVGKVSGATEIRECGVSGEVSTTSSLEVYVGGLVGYIYSAKTVIDGCYSTATVTGGTSSGGKVGGLIGYVWSPLELSNSYVTGKVVSDGAAAGALGGYFYTTSTNKVKTTNCYTACDVSGHASSRYPFAYIYSSYLTATNCFYESGRASSESNTQTGITAKDKNTLKQAYTTLGDAYAEDSAEGKTINGGYPILTWQYSNPDAKPTVTITVYPKDSELYWDGKEQTGGVDGVYTLTGQEQRSHTYLVKNEAGDFAESSGEITVKALNMSKTITLTPNYYTLTFTNVPDDATLTVKNAAGETVTGTKNVYSVPQGIYTYDVTGAFSYNDLIGATVTVKASGGAVTEEVQLSKEDTATVSFSYAEDADPTIKVTYYNSRTYKNIPMAPEEDGSYQLYVGYEYDWTFESDTYIKQSGTIDLTSAKKGDTEDVPVPMAKKPVGTGTEDDPYQIANDSQLRWFAEQVNSGKTAISARLDKDIALSDEAWTPIGQYARYAYTGTFDGADYTVSGLKITANTNSHYGLFGVVSSGGVIRKLTVRGEVTITGTGSSTSGYGIAGIIGKLDAGKIEQCINEVTVSGNYNTGGVVGYLNGESTISQCANKANIKGSNNVGGIAGNVYGKATVSDCYNHGAVTASGSYAGGIVGYLNATSSSYANKISNCYTIGTVSGSSSAAVVGKVNNSSYSTIQNCYFVSGSDSKSGVTRVEESELKDLSEGKFAQDFLKAFTKSPRESINDGYPILSWQIPTYMVTFTVKTGTGEDEKPVADAVVTIDGQTGTQNGDKWTFKLPDGTYTYTVTAFGYKAKTDGKVTVNGAEQTVPVTLEAAEKRTIRFTVTPANVNATITVTWNGQDIQAESDGSYLLPDGDYTYTVKAKGYGRVSEELTVAKDETIAVPLTPSRAWDGSETEQPDGTGTEADPYQIDSGAQLAWLANTVNNAASVTKLYAVLTDDIDLGGNDWTPIGVDFHEFSGSFDGKGHTVKGLNVFNKTDAGLFGVAQDATIKNVVVQGSVSGTSNAAGILAKAKTTACTIENCGNKAVVNSSGYAGGILGRDNISSSPYTTISSCYNTGAVTSTGSSSSGRAAGILGGNNGSTAITNCYNTGAITASSGYAGGIRGTAITSAGEITNCYSAADVVGSDGKTGAIVAGASGTLKNCFYREGMTNTHTSATSLTTTQMRTELLDKLGADNWKTVRGVNNDYPILQWQKDEMAAHDKDETLAKNAHFERELYTTDDGEESSLPTGKLKWEAKDGAESYTVSLWQAVKTWMPLNAEEKAAYDAAKTAEDKLWLIDDARIIENMTDEQRTQLAQLDDAIDEVNAALDSGVKHDRDTEQKLRQALSDAYAARAEFVIGLATDADLGYYDLVLKWVEDIPGVTGTEYNLASRFAALPEGIYYASAAVEENGQTAYVSLAQAESEVMTLQSPYNRMKAVTGVKWDDTNNGVAKWDGRENFTGNYRVDLYTTVDGTDYTFYRSFTFAGQYTSANFTNVFAAEKKYAFKVTAIADYETESELGLTNSIESGYSSVYDPAESTENPDKKDWVEISTAEQWIALANVKDEPSGDDTGSPSCQQVEWSKNYRLVNDIDFSTLSAADQVKTKSIGTKTYPFMGEFDGNDCKITGLTLSNSDSGLFWYTGATAYVHDLTIEGANVLFSDNAAVLVHNNYGRIEKCAVVNTNITADTGAVLGGMVSRNYGIIRDSYVQGGTLTSNTTTSVGHAGFAGTNEEGGLIERCWTSMSVSTQSMHAAGFVGLGYGGTIRNCFALGNVSARGYSGGFVGRSVYDGNIYENCYAAGTVTVTEAEGNGFIGGNQRWSSFQYDQSSGITNCYYNSATNSSNDYKAVAKSLTEMQSDAFLTALSGSESGVWAQSENKNNGLPYLENVKVPEAVPTEKITVKLAVVPYNKATYSFDLAAGKASIKTITMQSNGNTRLVDVMDEAVAKGWLTYEYATTSTYGRFIHTINGRAVDAPDGWMFIIKDKLSNVSASLATVKDGDTILWFEGTTENRFQGPTWNEVVNGQAVTIEWVDIESLNDLMELAQATDADRLGKHYRLTADLNLKDAAFEGIGSETVPFTGTFDGQGHTISNVTITKADGTNVGFFNVIKGATIKNLKLAKVSISGKENVGGLVGYAQAELSTEDLSKNKANLVGNCSVTGAVSGQENVGGLIGLNAGVTDQDTLFSIASAVDKCAAAAAVNGEHGTGGLVGNNSGTITKSYANGAATGKTTTGGLVGDNSGDIYDSHATGAVTGTSFTGGFAGSSGGTVKNCYSTGAVTGTDYTGGFAGAISNAENAVGAGQVTIKGTPTQGYNGGFAGQLNGVIAGLDNQITVRYVYGNCTQPDGTTISPIGNTSQYPNDAQKTALEKMELTTWDDVNEKLKELFGVSLFSAEPTELMDTIAGTYIDTKDAWAAMDMAAYQKLAGKTAKLTDEARQNVINLLITEAAKDSTGVNARTRIELVLHSLGVDTTRLYPVNSNTPVSNAAKLRTAADTVNNSNDAAWVLLANSQGSAKLTTAQVEKLVKLMTDELSDGDVYIWSNGGDSTISYDIMATALAALQPYVNSSSAAKNLAGRLLNALQSKIAQDPLFGNANTDAMVVIGLIAAGIDPDTVKCANGMTLTQDMLRYVTADGQGFWFADSSVVNPLATEQAFRALVALAQFKATGKAFNIYDFSDVKTGPSHATGEGETSKPADEPEGSEKITVTVTISTPSGIWLNNKSITVTEGSTVYHAFIKALDGSGIKQVGAENGYVSSMTKGGVTYGEFTSGTNSGWLYKVNGVLPNVPLTQKAVNNNDYVLWYYTTDWKADPDAGKMADEEVTAADVIKLIDAIGTVTRSSGNAIAAARTAYNKLSADQKALVTNYAKLTAAETAYAELIKEQAAGEANTETADGWRKTYSDALDSVKTDELVFGSEWLVIALARSGRDVPDSYYDSVVKAVQEAKGELSDKKFTEYSRTILALTAIGKDPTDVGGYDLLAKLADMDDVNYQGLNGAIFALIALDSGKYDVPVAAEGGKQTTRDGLLAYILEQQLSDGGWVLSGDNADPDMTAMALQALAPYRTGDAAVQTAVDKALQVLSNIQQADGGYSSWGTLNSESCAQVLIALASLGIDPASDSRFAKNGLTVLDALLAYALDGGFRHMADGKVDAIATEQALCAMTAYARLLDGKTALYDMADVLGGQTADTPDDSAADEQPAKTTPVVVWIALGVVALGGGTALIVVRRRRGE